MEAIIIVINILVILLIISIYFINKKLTNNIKNLKNEVLKKEIKDNELRKQDLRDLKLITTLQENKNSDLKKEMQLLKNTSENQSIINKNTNIVLNTYKEKIDQLEQINHDHKTYFNELNKVVIKLTEENNKIKKELEFFTQIKEDSTKLNENTNIQEENYLINKLLENKEEILVKKDSNENLSIFSNDENTIENPTKEITHSKPEETIEFNQLDIKLEENFENKFGLDNQQQEAYYYMEQSNRNIFISGRAGTGKSFLLKLFSKGTKKNHILVAPTGIAALNIDGVTVHSIFGYNNLQVNNNEHDYFELSNRKKELLRKIDVLIIDEISMVRADVFDQINKILQYVRKSKELFGGVQVIVFGDLFQLPPIVSRNEVAFINDKYGAPHFFNSNAYKFGDFKYIELFKNHRQNGDQEFFNILNDIRQGIVKEEYINKLNERYIPTEEHRRILKILPKKDQVDYINSTELEAIKAKQYEFNYEVTYNRDNLNDDKIESYFPISQILKLKLGALIMMVKNDHERKWVNGTLGIISYIDNDRIKVNIDGREYEVLRETFYSYEAVYIKGKIHYEIILSVVQFPIILAYAITIHKSQGQTYKQVACDLSETFSVGQSYVALSRCSSLSGLHLMKKITGHEIKTDRSIKGFYDYVISNNSQES